MKGRKLLTVILAGALFVGAAVITNAAELDFAWYAKQNPDVVEELGDSPEMLKLHYDMFGRKEARMANEHDMEGQLRQLFIAEEYAALYPEIKTIYGDDTEAMFQHYVIYGLLEARRPREKVSQAAALSLKADIEKAFQEVDVMVQPGSVQLLEIITGTISEEIGGEKMQQALTQASPVVGQAIEDLLTDVMNPKQDPAEDSAGDSQSVSSSSAVIAGGTNAEAVTVAKADWAPLADYNNSSGDALKEELKKVNEAMANCVETAAHDTYEDITVVTFDAPEDAAIPKHTNVNGDTAYFFGIETPYNGEEYAYNWGFTSGKAENEEAAAIEAVNADFSESKGKTAEDGENAAFYWGLTTEKQGTDRWGYLAVKDSDDRVVAKYILDFAGVSFADSEP